MYRWLLPLLAVALCSSSGLADTPSAIVVDGRSLLPIRYVAEALGATVTFDKPTKSIKVARDTTSVWLTLGSPIAKVNDRTTVLDASPLVEHGVTYVPVRSVCESLGAEVEWDKPTRQIVITDAIAGKELRVPIRGSGKAEDSQAPGQFGVDSTAAGQKRPGERVSPGPECNPNAVVWRTPDPPSNPQAGDVWVYPTDGKEMVFVPAGEFLMGASDGEFEALLQAHPDMPRVVFAAEVPQRRVHLDAFWIDKTEVTNAEYEAFRRFSGRSRPSYYAVNDEKYTQPNQPVGGVNWDDAAAYAEWAGKRLPTEAEWEKAARSTDGRKYPWGDADPGAGGEWRCNFYVADDGFEATSPVGSFPRGASPYGCLDMAGNVAEWCADWHDGQYYNSAPTQNPKGPASGSARVLRGGYCQLNSDWVRCASRTPMAPSGRYLAEFGFRCVLGQEQLALRQQQASQQQQGPAQQFVTEVVGYDQFQRPAWTLLKNTRGEEVAQRVTEFSRFNPTQITDEHTNDLTTRKTIHTTEYDPSGTPRNPMFLCLDKDGNLIRDKRGEAVLVEPFRAVQRGESETEYNGAFIFRKTTKIYPCENAAQETGIANCTYVW